MSILTGPQLIGALTGDWPRDDLELVLTEIPAHMEGYDHAEEYDSINEWERNKLSREGRTLRQSDIEYTPNFSSVVIDAVNNRLLISAVTATAGADEDTAASDAATAQLAEIIKDNELASRYRDWNRKALRDGDAYMVVWPKEEQGPDAQTELSNDIDTTDGLGPLPGVNITYIDPRGARMFYDPENPRRKLFFAYMWEMTLAGEKKPRVRINLMYPDRIEKWISTPGSGERTAKQFSPFLDPDDDADNDYLGSGGDNDDDPAPAGMWPLPNPYGEVPAFHLRTAYEYGKPVHRNAFALQDEISRMSEMLDVTVEFTGFPQRYAIQEADSLGTQSIREDPLAEHSPADWDRDTSASPLNETSIASGAISNETGSNYESNPGALQVYKNFKEVGSFATATPASYLDPLKWEVGSIATTTGTPMWKFQGIGGNPPSGEALKIMEAPAVQLAQDLMQMFGGGCWEPMYEFALRIIGVTAKVKVSWANPATSDLAATWDLVKLMIELGVPRDVAFMKAGVTEAEAQEWAKTYDDVFANAAYYQGRALAYRSQADLYQQQAIAAKIANGVPQRQALIEGGYSEADVDSWLAEREQELTLGRKVALLEQLGSAMQSIGMAVSLGVLSAPGANDVISAVLGELIPEVPAENLDVDGDAEDMTLEDLLPPVGLPMAPAQLGVIASNEPPMPPGQGAYTEPADGGEGDSND